MGAALSLLNFVDLAHPPIRPSTIQRPHTGITPAGRPGEQYQNEYHDRFRQSPQKRRQEGMAGKTRLHSTASASCPRASRPSHGSCGRCRTTGRGPCGLWNWATRMLLLRRRLLGVVVVKDDLRG